MGLASCLETCLELRGQITENCAQNCNTENGWSAPLTTAETAVYSVATALLVVLTTVIACMMGSTLGIDMATLQAGIDGNDSGVRRKSRRVVRLRSIGGSLLFSALLVTTVATHVAVAVMLTKLLGAIGGLLVAFALILVFAEILPPAFCSTHALEIAWSTAWLASLLLVLLFPVAWPVSVLLDSLIVHEKTHTALARWCFPCCKNLQHSPSMETISPQYNAENYSEDDQETYSAPFGDSGKLTSGGTPSIPSTTSPPIGYLPQHADRSTLASSGKSQSTSSTPPIAQVLDPGPYLPETSNNSVDSRPPPPIAAVIDDSSASPSRRDDPHEMTFKDLVDPSESQKDELERLPQRPLQVSPSQWEARRGREEASDSSSQSQARSLSQSQRYSAMSSASTDSTSAGERVSSREAVVVAGGGGGGGPMGRGGRQGGGGLERRAMRESPGGEGGNRTARQVTGAMERRAMIESQSPGGGRGPMRALERRVSVEGQSPQGREGIAMEGEGGSNRSSRKAGVVERRVPMDSLGTPSPRQGGAVRERMERGGVRERVERGEDERGGVWRGGIGAEWRSVVRQGELEEESTGASGGVGGSGSGGGEEGQRMEESEVEEFLEGDRPLAPTSRFAGVQAGSMGRAAGRSPSRPTAEGEGLPRSRSGF